MEGELDGALADWLVGAGLAPDRGSIRAEPLTGGVASDIWRIEVPGRVFAVKRALAKLRVAREWRAPVSRNAGEVAWLETAGAILPSAAPRVLAHEPAIGAFAMEYLGPADHPVWKAELRAGRADPAFAASVGRAIATIHSRTAHRLEIAGRFGDDALFTAIRLEPYLIATGEAHPAIAAEMASLVEATLANKQALVHGDVSPKNILVGPAGPVFLDAECAWYGDPAFDLAFCLNHLLLKCLWNPHATQRFLAAFDALAEGYFAAATYSPRGAIEARAARLLPALFLARIDGKSPVEYVTEASDKDLVRSVALPLIHRPASRLAEIRGKWAVALAARVDREGSSVDRH